MQFEALSGIAVKCGTDESATDVEFKFSINLSTHESQYL